MNKSMGHSSLPFSFSIEVFYAAQVDPIQDANSCM
jgi:hypothetical protein